MKRNAPHARQLLWLKRAAVEGSRLDPKARRNLYFKTGFYSIALIWCLVALLMWLTPAKYVSHWTLILPGAGAGAMVSLDSLGQASASTSSPYLSSAIDPRENYKAIVMSDPVLMLAASRIKESAGAFGKPKLKLPSQTGLMEFASIGATPEIASARAWALYESLQDTLIKLRMDEISQREAGVRQGLNGFAAKVSESQQRILAYQSERGLVSLDQFKELALTTERLRQSRTALESSLRGLEASRDTLAHHLGLDVEGASALLKLKNDQLFQALLMSDTRLKASLTELGARLGSRHPQIQTLSAEAASVRQGLKQRCEALLGNCQLEHMLMLSADDVDSRAQLMQQLISLATEADGKQHELESLDIQLKDWEHRLEASKKDAARLEDLNREHQLATAVFTSAAARMDVGKADIYAAYPMLQLMAAPELPKQPDPVGPLLILVGGLAASVSIIAGLSLLWIRKPILHKLLMKG
ncbi:exopolysaccharide biosynthesis protein [Shewanella sp. JM162201]|uniref:Exopolysaccharide biosynthesis protein n=1 Tax=Shewanella jiangmenensis TaxID=2837387 RepID=A0ABS5UZE5_9GAMM|nr:exopolysaccharide biosynthesis protein [Shewanella jiangmenensis]MBT1442985.1 exopolysaccharide biosynthesis protein [Shewanella jiangmenensis]